MATIAYPGLILAIALALVHGFATQLPIFSIIPRFRWASFAGGVSISYVFLEILPELGHAQEELLHSEFGMVDYLKNHVYILALIGLLVFYGLDLLAFKANSSQSSIPKTSQNTATIFWIRVSAFAMINAILGYVLQDLSEHSLIACILFFITFALHFFIIDDNLREHQASLYDRVGRWVLVGAIVFGAIIAQVVHLNEALIAIVMSFLAGSIILNVLKRELPDETENCFGSFLFGAIFFAVLLLSI